MYLHPRYDEATQPDPGDQIPDNAECADCGRTSGDFGRFRKAEAHEQSDADGEVYECGYCGCTMIVHPAKPVCQLA